ncbi:MAG: S1C family serine protease, partial [Streptomyces sp.]|nr:S1C family serine protease [Streptomyces sp.]
MTESFRRSGEYDSSQGDGQQSASHPQQHASSTTPQWPAPPTYDPGTTGWPGDPAGMAAAGHGDGSPALPAAAPARRKRSGGTLALLAAVAIVAAALGGGTAYGIQELTGKNAASSNSSTSTNVVPTGKKGTVAGVAAAVSPSIVEIKATSDSSGQSTGSGVIITSNGEIITNNHVVSGASSVKVTTSDGRRYTARVVGT